MLLILICIVNLTMRPIHLCYHLLSFSIYFEVYHNVLLVCYAVERILNDSRTVFEDVVEDFADPELISRRFARWRREYGDSYAEAYISLCVSKLVVPLVRLSLIGWNPLQAWCFSVKFSYTFGNIIHVAYIFGKIIHLGKPMIICI